MSQTDKISAILIEMDCLMDTRIGTLATYYSPEQVIAALKNNYHERDIDKFYGIDYHEFHDHYEHRNKDVLRASFRTMIHHVLTEFIKDTINNNINTPYTYIPKVILNTYPYELTIGEQALFKDIIVTITGGMADVELIHLPYIELTPMYLRKETTMVIFYDYDQWLEAQSVNGAFKKHTCPEIGMLSPALYKKSELTEEDKRIHASLKMPPFEYLSRQLQPFIQAVFLPVSVFSLPIRAK